MSHNSLNTYSPNQLNIGLPLELGLSYFQTVSNESGFALFTQTQWKLDLKTHIGSEILLRVPRPNDEQWANEASPQDTSKGTSLDTQYLDTLACIQFAETHQLLETLTHKIVEKVLRNADKLDPNQAPYFINVPPPVVNENFVAIIKNLLDQSEIAYPMIGIELTEREAVADTKAFIKGIKAFQALQIPIALDDYGAGHSTMEFLENVPVARVKIDRGFLSAAKESASKLETLRALVTFATKSNIDVVAEGVENAADFDFIQQLGCHGLQGFYVEAPKLLIPVDA